METKKIELCLSCFRGRIKRGRARIRDWNVKIGWIRIRVRAVQKMRKTRDGEFI